MANRAPHRYDSPLRKAQAAATRDRILDSVGALIDAGDEPTYLAVAEHAAVQERTVYRHFATKDDLYRAFWERVNRQRMGIELNAVDLRSLEALVARLFTGFSQQEPFVRAMLHSEQGRGMRLAYSERRRAAYQRVAAAELPGVGAAARRRAAAATQILCSAMAWEYLRDYWNMNAAQATATIQQAIAALFEGLRAPRRKPRGQRKEAR